MDNKHAFYADPPYKKKRIVSVKDLNSEPLSYRATSIGARVFLVIDTFLEIEDQEESLARDRYSCHITEHQIARVRVISEGRLVANLKMLS